MNLASDDIRYPGQLLKQLKEQFAKATTQEEKAVLLQKHAAVELQIRQLLNLVSMPAISDQIN
jgi:hypothetical protein